MTVLLMWQTQHFILCRCQRTYSHFQTKTPCHLVTQSIKITSHVVHFQLQKQKISVYFFYLNKWINSIWISENACQLWNKYTQTSMKRFRAAYNNAYRIMHYIPRNVSVRPYQVSHCVTTFDAVLRNNLYRFFIRCTSSSNFFIRSLQMSDAFNKSSFFPNYSTLLYGEQMQ